MPVGYGYQERGDAGYVNWAAVTKGFVDVLNAEKKRKEAIEKQYEDQDREIGKTLSDQPLGQFEDGNTFTNNAVDIITNQKLMDYKLWRSGRLSDKQYRLKQNNMIDNINTLFDLQKKYQEESEKRMKGLQDQSLQPLTASNMALIEGFKDFKDSVPVIDPNTNIVSIAKKKYNEKTKTWEIDKTKTMPVNMAMSLIMKPAEAFKVDDQIDSDVKNMGELKTSILQRATLSGAGSVTSFVNSPEAFEKNFPGGKKIVDEFNDAINKKIEQYLIPKLNLTSVLTMNVKGYDAESFVYDREEAAKDPSKILMKIDPITKYPTMDDTGPHYQEQYKKAADWIKTQFMSRIDREKNIQTSTGQLSDATLGSRQFEYGKEQKQQGAKNLGENVGKFFTGSTNDQSDASNYLNKIGVPNYITEDAEKNPIFNVMGPDGKYVQFTPKTPNEVRSAISSIMGFAKKYIADTEIDETDAVKYARGFSQGKSVNKPGKSIGGAKEVSSETNPYNDFVKDIDSSIPSSIFSNTEGNAITPIMDVIEKYNLTAEETTPGKDYIKIKTKGAVPDEIELSFDESDPTEQARQKKRLMDFIRRVGKSELRLEGDEVATPAPTPPAPGANKKPDTSKYNTKKTG